MCCREGTGVCSREGTGQTEVHTPLLHLLCSYNYASYHLLSLPSFFPLSPSLPLSPPSFPPSFSPSAPSLPPSLFPLRYEKLAEQEELSSQQQRRRLFAELQQERDKMATQFQQRQRALEQEHAEMQVEREGGRTLTRNVDGWKRSQELEGK